MSVKKRIKKFNKQILFLILKYVLPIPGHILIQLISSTYRIRIMGKENETNTKGSNTSNIYAGLHQSFFLGFRLTKPRRPIAVMISRSRDAEGIAQIATLSGMTPVRGSSSKGKKYKGGREALEQLKSLTGGGYNVCHAVDGPLGPFGVVKPGLIKLAQITGSPILVTTMTTEKKWMFSSWDKFILPRPFSRNIIHLDKPVHVPPDLNDKQFEEYRLLTEQKLHDNKKKIETIWKDTEMVKDIFKNYPNT